MTGKITPAISGRGVALALCCCAFAACATLPPTVAPDALASEHAFSARRFEASALPEGAWTRAQWLGAALRLNPELAEARARATAIAAAKRTAGERPNPTLNLYDQYVTAAAGGTAWLYGLSLEFLLRRPGERARALRDANLQTEAVEADVAETIWQLRSNLRGSLLDVAATRDELALLKELLAARQTLLGSIRAQAEAGERAMSDLQPALQALASTQQRLLATQARGGDAKARLAAAVGVPLAALEGVALEWPGWSDLKGHTLSFAATLREQALIARPELVRALREYDLAENDLQGAFARRWPEFRLSPGLAWDRSGVHENQLNENLRDNELGLALELPLFNRHAGPIGEAWARRELAAAHIEVVQSHLREQIDRAEQAWPLAHQGWLQAVDAAAAAERQLQAAQRALSAGDAERSTLLQATSGALEAQLLVLQSAYEAQQVFAALEAAYRRPLEGPECDLPLTWRSDPRG